MALAKEIILDIPNTRKRKLKSTETATEKWGKRKINNKTYFNSLKAVTVTKYISSATTTKSQVTKTPKMSLNANGLEKSELQLKTIGKKWLKFLSRCEFLNKLNIPTTLNRQLQSYTVAVKQSDSYNCGIFVALVIRTLDSGLTVEPTFNPDVARMVDIPKMLNALLDKFTWDGILNIPLKNGHIIFFLRENQYRILDVSKKLALFMCSEEDRKFKAKNITAKLRHLYGTVQNLKKKVQLNLGALSSLFDEDFDIPALKRRREVDYIDGDDKVCDVSLRKKS
ncbi:hypothetical protein Btru_048341 [Bulinus truncatus]|nr:hypothetical protein Btru_048341 [Bulinus truncatus]